MIDVACAIILKDDKILVTQRSEKMSLPLKWEFPGGKIENDETAENCILREIKEELNIEIEIIGKLETKTFDYSNFSINLIPFISNYICGDLILTEHKYRASSSKISHLLHFNVTIHPTFVFPLS